MARRGFWRLGLARLGLARLGLALLAAAAGVPARADTSPMGEWFTEDRGGVVRIQPCAGALCGYIVGLSGFPEAASKVDVHGTPQCHLLLLAGLHPQDDGRWHGTVTNPEDGRTYHAEVWVPGDGTLRLRGYIGLPIFGQTQRWPRFHGQVRQDCQFN